VQNLWNTLRELIQNGKDYGLNLNPVSLNKIVNSSRTIVCRRLLAAFGQNLPSLSFAFVCICNTQHHNSLLPSSSFRTDHQIYIQHRTQKISLFLLLFSFFLFLRWLRPLPSLGVKQKAFLAFLKSYIGPAPYHTDVKPKTKHNKI